MFFLCVCCPRRRRALDARVSRARARRARAPGSERGLAAFGKQCSAAKPCRWICRVQSYAEQQPSTLEVSQLSCSAVLSLGAVLPSVLLDASWHAAQQHKFGPPSPNRWCTLIAKPVLRTQPQRRASCIRAGRGLLASPHCPAAAQRTPRDAAAAHKAMGFGAGDIKDKFRTYDGDADKRLRKKLEKSGKFDESFKTPVRIEKINVEVMGRWVSERLAELLGFEDDVLSELVMNMRVLGVPRCRGAVTPSTRLVSIRRGRGWFRFDFGAVRTDLTEMLRAGSRRRATRRRARTSASTPNNYKFN